NENIAVIYLTLFGSDPNEKIMQEKVIQVSYEKHIKSWLENCIKEVSTLPTLRETFVQYLNLIKKLTNQSQNRGLTMEIKDLLLKENNLKMMIEAQSAIVESKIEVQILFWEELKKQLLDRGYEFEFVNRDFQQYPDIKDLVKKYYSNSKNRTAYGLRYKITDLDSKETKDALWFFIGIEWNILYGFTLTENSIRKNLTFETRFDNLKEKILNIKEFQWEETNSWWIGWKYPEKRLNFNAFNSDNIFDLVDKVKRKEHIQNIVLEINAMIKAVKPLENSFTS
ncbi:MAG: hypothetical protein JXQ76_08335, partial [Campylobacterales bacterium]|nr:hypothetical protein [Campylobacterales bacterium]